MHIKMVKMVNVVLCIFYYSKNVHVDPNCVPAFFVLTIQYFLLH